MPVEKPVYKNAIKMVYGQYNWTLASENKEGLIYITSTRKVSTADNKVALYIDSSIEVYVGTPGLVYLGQMSVMLFTCLSGCVLSYGKQLAPGMLCMNSSHTYPSGILMTQLCSSSFNV